MKIALASDHGGFSLKKHIKEYLNSNGYEIIDFGTDNEESCDYPDYAHQAALSVSKGEAQYGIVICTTGIGVSIVANKVKGVRCALVTNVEDARLTRQHNDTNCLAMGRKNVSNELGVEIVETWLNTSFDGGRHVRRVEKILKIEE